MAKKKKNLRRLMGYSMTMGGTALIASGLPEVAAVPVRAVSTAGSVFVAPLAAVTGAGIVVSSLGELKPKKRRRRKR